MSFIRRVPNKKDKLIAVPYTILKLVFYAIRDLDTCILFNLKRKTCCITGVK